MLIPAAWLWRRRTLLSALCCLANRSFRFLRLDGGPNVTIQSELQYKTADNGAGGGGGLGTGWGQQDLLELLLPLPQLATLPATLSLLLLFFSLIAV